MMRKLDLSDYKTSFCKYISKLQNKAGNEKNDSNDIENRVEIFGGRTIFRLLVSIFLTLANYGWQQKQQNQSSSTGPHFLDYLLYFC